ncbi:helix-turn-helix transcriptional regulator [Aliidiomarina sp. B3213]|uniref:helix-turn-helix transcriptional regulator n=1 Tax=Gammaproteobacteria TaxID=1236 RepID=UPI000DD0C455|nr:helix-turn-helix transcriptional regulator [Aliidiomarina sp. B3213]RTE86910.1 transcriptional regulator [Aliidiomarina sp. B3213]TCZ93300.1 transcriptional regulator [Lysobacter sp. N42]
MAKLPITNSVREFREQLDMTQGELGDKVNVTRQTIAAIEQRRYSPSLEVAFRIAHEFNQPLETVFQYVPET